jgi:hypothetical protein
MSLLYSLLRFIDVNEYRMQEADKRQKREKRDRQDDGDGDGDGGDDGDELSAVTTSETHRALAEGPRRLVCRICGHRGDDWFCPDCLADTMGPLPTE